jgi:rhodanese-related sulfurtransferase
LKKVISALFVSALVLTGCSSSDSAITNLGAAEFVSQSQAADVVIVDVRTAAEFNEGHIVNALNIDVESINFDSDLAGLDKSFTYALYCRSGNRSSIAAGKMSEAGFTSILNAQVGFIDLLGAGAIPA